MLLPAHYITTCRSAPDFSRAGSALSAWHWVLEKLSTASEVLNTRSHFKVTLCRQSFAVTYPSCMPSLSERGQRMDF